MREIIKASLTYKVVWRVTLTLIDELTCNVLEGVVSTLKESMLVLRVPVLAPRVSVLVLKDPTSVFEAVL